MRKSKTVAKLRAGKPVRMCALGHFIPAFVRLAAEFGYDCIWLDTEHRAMEQRELQALLAYFHLFDIDCMLRAPTIEKTPLYRYLEDGASGLMIPHVSTVEKAQALVQATKFPPLGDRGLDGAGLDSDFIVQGGPDYPAAANEETFLVVQIETTEAVANVEEIAAVDGIDGLFVGPGDLGLRLRYEDVGYDVDEATQRVAAAARKNGKAWGRPAGSEELVRKLHSEGAQLIAFGSEFGAIYEKLQACGDTLGEVYG